MSEAEHVVAISQLVVRERESRDLHFWNRMLDCYHPDSRVSISWFRGSGPEFVEASKDMVARGMLATHRLGPVLVTLNGRRAVASLAGIIDVPTEVDGIACVLSAHATLWFGAERRDGAWRLSLFEGLYRRDELRPAVAGQSVVVPAELLAAYRPSYRNLCYSLRLKGYEPDPGLPGEDRPETVRALLQRFHDWAGLAVPD